MKYHLILITSLLIALNSCAQNNESMDKDTTKYNVNLSEEEWKDKLTDEQYYILRESGTERPFTGEFVFHKDEGTYKCAGCGAELFTDEMKFDSHCGWPSFDREIEGGKILQTRDTSHGMIRTEITCANCGGHLGHIFDDGPTETGKRYCVNSVALEFAPKEKSVSSTEVVTLGGGCFWCIEAVFDELNGVHKVESGYSGGDLEDPTYEDVVSGETGHAEVIQITFDPSIITFEELLEVFFTMHDPTTLNKQGPDIGTQYRSAIFYHNKEQKGIAERVIDTLNANKVFDNPIVTEVTAYSEFYKAENYHQDYYKYNRNQPYCRMFIAPKMEKLEKVFKDKI